jgi:hypothetical protein
MTGPLAELIARFTALEPSGALVAARLLVIVLTVVLLLLAYRVVVVVVVALRELGVDVGAIVVSASVLGIGIGLGGAESCGAGRGRRRLGRVNPRVRSIGRKHRVSLGGAVQTHCFV